MVNPVRRGWINAYRRVDQSALEPTCPHGDRRRLEDVRRYAAKAWRYWLSRRRSKSAIGWEKFPRLVQTSVLPTPKLVPTI
jgi:hypothetical protein